MYTSNSKNFFCSFVSKPFDKYFPQFKMGVIKFKLRKALFKRGLERMVGIFFNVLLNKDHPFNGS